MFSLELFNKYRRFVKYMLQNIKTLLNSQSLYILLKSATLGYKAANLTVEVIGFEQFFEGEVHAVAPIVEGIGRYVDALEVGVGITQMLVDGHPIL